MKKNSKATQNLRRKYGKRAIEIYCESPDRTVADVEKTLKSEGVDVSRGTLYRWRDKDHWDDERNRKPVDKEQVYERIMDLLSNPDLSPQRMYALTRVLDRIAEEEPENPDGGQVTLRYDKDDTHIERLEKLRDYYLEVSQYDTNENMARARVEIVQRCNSILREHRKYAERVAAEVFSYIEQYAIDNDKPLLREFVGDVESLAQHVALRLGAAELK
ncbi:MAG: hypothetical protein K8R90_05255 [Candidatus Cloacimonetes bacterium]|nr:hypothetical protein [Candidatus Cloacimonadota bacterium]